MTDCLSLHGEQASGHDTNQSVRKHVTLFVGKSFDMDEIICDSAIKLLINLQVRFYQIKIPDVYFFSSASK